MRSALVTTVNPVDPKQGDEWRAYGLLKGLESLGEVDLVQWGGRLGGSHRIIPDTGLKRALRAVPGLVVGPPFGSLPYRVALPHEPHDAYDIVAAYPLKAARWALRVPGRLHLLDLTDSLGMLRGSLPALYRGQRFRLFGAGREELALGRRFSECWVASSTDADYLRARGLDTVVVPNGAQVRRPLPWADPRRLLFVGNLAYPPNRRGLLSFLRDVWPSIGSRGYHLDLVGRGTEEWAQGSTPHVAGHGRVEDLEPWYRSHGIVICPVEVSAGTPSKVLEALGFGRPVVAWASGIRGLSEEEAAAVLPVRQDDEWYPAIARLQDRAEWERIARLAPGSVALWGEPQAARLQELIGSLFSTRSPEFR